MSEVRRDRERALEVYDAIQADDHVADQVFSETFQPKMDEIKESMDQLEDMVSTMLIRCRVEQEAKAESQRDQGRAGGVLAQSQLTSVESAVSKMATTGGHTEKQGPKGPLERVYRALVMNPVQPVQHPPLLRNFDSTVKHARCLPRTQRNTGTCLPRSR